MTTATLLFLACQAAIVLDGTAPSVAFLSPTDGLAFGYSDNVVVRVEATDAETPSADLTLTFTLDGVPLDGTFVRDGDVVSLAVGQLAPGGHTTSVTVTDSDGQSTTVEVEFSVSPNAAPSVTWVEPTDGAYYARGARLEVQLQFEDPDEDDLAALSLVWGGDLGGMPGLPDAPYSDGTVSFFVDLDRLGGWDFQVDVTDSEGSRTGESVHLEVLEPDEDRDGYTTDKLGGDDCDDADRDVNPGAVEVCDGIDNDCNEGADEDSAVGAPTWYADSDGDGWGDLTGQPACEQPAFTADRSGDCDDGDPTINPGAAEVCDPLDVDEDCDAKADDLDGSTDPGTKSRWYADADTDGFGNPGLSVDRCDAPAGWVADDTDCDDGDADVKPGGSEVCDPFNDDEDCDGYADDADSSATGQLTYYTDGDRDGWGDAKVLACDLVSGLATRGGDCDDANAAVSPGEAEVCDPVDLDEDCDGVADDADSSVTGELNWYLDSDKDGYGSGSSSASACSGPTGYVSNNSDCDDTDGTISPAATEVCDSANTDEDCDSRADDLDASATGKTTWYLDTDKDGWGGATIELCDATSSVVSSGGDCNDANRNIYPGGTEVCDLANADEDCDGYADDADSTAVGKVTVYTDADGDGWGTTGTSVTRCDSGGGYATQDGDCDDGDSTSYPGAFEVCEDGIDQDCDTRDLSCGPIDFVDADVILGGALTYLYLGYELSTLDIDNDGADDLAVGTYSDQSFLWYGPITADEASSSADSRQSTSGALSYGYPLGEVDLDDDGKKEIAVSDYYATVSGYSYAGAIYLYEATLAASETTHDGLLWSGGASDYLSAQAFADVDGDGDDDALVGAYGDATSGSTGSGSAWFIEGPLTLGTLSAPVNDTAWLYGNASYDELGRAVAIPGDMDGDGVFELAVTASGEDTGGSTAGALYIFSGVAASGSIRASDYDTRWVGEVTTDTIADTLVSPGDMDGDGSADLLVADTFAGGSVGGAAGAAYLVSGAVTGSSSLASADVRIFPEDSATELGADIVMGDFNGDGWPDLVTSSKYAGVYGAAWLLYGPVSGHYDLPADADRTIEGSSGEGYYTGASLARGDWNGDGDLDLAVGAYLSTYGTGTNAGSVGLFFGPL